MIVITLEGGSHGGKRVALLLKAGPGAGEVTSTCASIDLDLKHLPQQCRQFLDAAGR
jgi:hypothetical protein